MNIHLLTENLPTFIRGFILCASLIIAIGPQNLFVLQQGLRNQHRFATAFICVGLDFLLIGLGIGGVGTLIAANPLIMQIALYGGVLFLGFYGLLALRSALRGPADTMSELAAPATISVKKTIATTLAVSTLNPAAYFDTLLMIGTTSGQYGLDARMFFGVGAMSASTIWFFVLAYGSCLLTPLFKRSIAWRVLDVTSGCFMLGTAAAIFCFG